MTRPSSSRSVPASHPYRLVTPPSMAWGSHITLVARGRRFRTRQVGDRAQLTPSPEAPTEPESSPPRPGRHLHRTRVLPARYRDSIYLEAPAVTVPELHELEDQALRSPDSDPFVDTLALTPAATTTTTTTGIRIGTGTFHMMSLRELPIATFKAPMPYEDFFDQKVKLDLPRGGVAPAQFQSMVGECEGCKRIMWIRNKDYHRCPGKNARATVGPARKLFSLLDSTAGGEGITKNQYENLFASCHECNLVFLRSAASQHSHTK